MNEEQPLPPAEPQRPTKKQRELLEFIRQFIVEHGYGPSYREIMVGCNYTSVATVAVHVNNLISRGHLRKKGRNARSLEIVGMEDPLQPQLQTNILKEAEEKWLIGKVDYLFQQAEGRQVVSQAEFDNLQVVVESLKILGLEPATPAFVRRLNDIKLRIVERSVV